MKDQTENRISHCRQPGNLDPQISAQLAESDIWPGFYLPTGPAKPVRSGTGIPVRFGRKPVGTGGSQIWIQISQFKRFVPVYYFQISLVWLVTGRFDRFTSRFDW